MGITQLRNLLTNRYKCKHVYNYHISPDITSARNAVDIRKQKVIDMKQTVEEAAMQELMSSYAIVVEGELVYQRQAMLNMFRKGAEWQSRQSPWISVKERLPEQNELVLCRMVSNEAIVSGFIIPMPSGRPRVVTLPDFEFEDYGDYVCDMWTPIPSFDEILEANKDVLERIKEKGD